MRRGAIEGSRKRERDNNSKPEKLEHLSKTTTLF